MTAKTIATHAASISRGLEQLRHDIGALVDSAARRPSANKRAALVDTHHQLRLLGQRLNDALGADTKPAPPEEQP
ncbi:MULTISPECIES: hypothetical protein [unclassified Micromonospora]|uniref:hypothetical protein n=1 Tax=unclassified Micromonospora TaxID=2617518 RepID=UPI003638E57C